MQERNFSRDFESHLASQPAVEEPPTSSKFEMIARGDFIKPGWWHWRCRCEDAEGNAAYGYVEADPLGAAVAPDTFEKDRC